LATRSRLSSISNQHQGAEGSKDNGEKSRGKVREKSQEKVSEWRKAAGRKGNGEEGRQRRRGETTEENLPTGEKALEKCLGGEVSKMGLACQKTFSHPQSLGTMFTSRIRF